MKPLFFLIILLTLCAPALAQSSTAKILERISHNPEDTLSLHLCSEYVANAQREIAQGKLYLDEATLPKSIHGSRSFWEILARQYEVTATFVNGGDFVPEETWCYNECMTEAIEAKYGRGILLRVAQRADSLNRIGQGFQEARPTGAKTPDDLFRQQFAYKADFRRNRRLQVSISFTVDQQGKVSNLRLQQCRQCLGPVFQLGPLPNTHRYYTEARRILRSRRWQPANLAAQPVKATVSVWLNPSAFYPNASF